MVRLVHREQPALSRGGAGRTELRRRRVHGGDRREEPHGRAAARRDHRHQPRAHHRHADHRRGPGLGAAHRRIRPAHAAVHHPLALPGLRMGASRRAADRTPLRGRRPDRRRGNRLRAAHGHGPRGHGRRPARGADHRSETGTGGHHDAESRSRGADRLLVGALRLRHVP